jgi:uncharacterized protein YjdB
MRFRVGLPTVVLWVVVALLTACGDNNVPASPTLVVSPPEVTLAIRQTAELSAAYHTLADADVAADDVTWSSSDTSRVTVVGTGATATVTGVATGTATITATGKDGLVGMSVVTVSPKMLVSIELDPVDPSIHLGTTVELTAIGHYDDDSTADLTTQVTWTSATTSVATIDNTGLVTSAGVGASVVTATSGSIQGSTTVTVTDAELVSLAITPADPSIPRGTAQRFVATGTYTDNTTQDITDTVTWSSSDEAIATISNTAGTRGRAQSPTTGNLGTVTITATAPTPTITATTTLTVTSATLVSLAIEPRDPSIPRGTSQAFTATGTYTDATTQDLTDEVNWDSSATTVATISNTGATKGTAQSSTSGSLGTTTITATMPSTTISDSTVLTVTDAELVSIDVTPASASIPRGTDQPFVATGTYTDNTTQDLTDTVTWTSSMTNVATVSNGASPGVAQSPNNGDLGETTITATDSASGVAGSAVLTVTAATLVSIAIEPPDPTIPKGTTQQFEAIGTYTDATTQNLTDDVTWSSSMTAIATISNAGSFGLATSPDTGSTGATTITATYPLTTISGSTTLTVTSAALVSISVTPATASIPKGTTQAFVATGLYTDNSIQDLTQTVTWSSSMTNVATISNTGPNKGTAQSPNTGATGTTTITAQVPSTTITATAALTVTDAALVSIAVTPATASIAKGRSQAFIATGTYTDNNTQDLTSQVTWSSSVTGVATISNAGPNKGTAQSPNTGMTGDTTITATFPSTTISGTATLTVTAAVLESIAVTPATASIPRGTDQAFVATGTFSDSSVQDLTQSVTWTSSVVGVATISNGASRGIATSPDTGLLGMTTITATDTTTMISNTAILEVTAAELVSIAVTPTTATIPKGTDQQFTAIGTYTDNSVQDLTSSVTWTSSNVAVATVTPNGGFADSPNNGSTGTTTIRATVPATTITATATLTVTDAVLVSLAISPTNPSIPKGRTRQFTATGTYSDATNKDLTTDVLWESSNTGIATIANTGTDGLATSPTSGTTGTTTITATMPSTTITASTLLTVTPAILIAIAVTPANPSIAKGRTQAFVATGTYSDNSIQNLTTAVTWSSSVTNVATISNIAGSEGLATSSNMGSTGTTTITATFPATTISGSTVLTVTPAVLVSLAIDPPNPSVALGRSQPFTATGTYSDASVADLTNVVTWSSSMTNVATISNNTGVDKGTATSATTPGTTTITAIYPSTTITASTTLTVTAAVLESIDVIPVTTNMPLGTTQNLVARGTFSDGSQLVLTSSVTWSTSMSTRATVSSASPDWGHVTAVGVGPVTITATDPSTMIAGSADLTITAAVLQSIQVTPAASSVANGVAVPFVATGVYSDLSIQDLTTSVTWSATPGTVATISNASGSNGLASTVGMGTATITATAGTLSGSTTLTVTPATLVRIDVTPANQTLPRASTDYYTATGVYSDASVQDLTMSVTWTSSSTATATISNGAGSEGQVSTLAAGTTTIIATDSASGMSGTTTLTVTNANLVSIAVTPASASIAVGSRQQFIATGMYDDGTTRVLTNSVAWSSSANNIAGMNGNPRRRGIALAKKAGSATITATLGSISGSAALTVINATLVSLAITPSTVTIPRNTKQSFRAIGTFSDGSTSDYTAVVSWSSSLTSVATISNQNFNEGIASAVSVGTTTIRAADPTSGIMATATLTVSNATLVSLAIAPANLTIVRGLTFPMIATATFSDSSTKDVTQEVAWTSSNTAIVTVTNTTPNRGIVSALAAGSITLTVQYPLTAVFGTTGVTVLP